MDNYIFITGATSGFGEAMAKKYASNNWNLILTGRRKEKLEQISSALKQEYNINIISLNFDISKEGEVIAACETIPLEIKSKISILVNNAGLAVGRGSIDDGVTDDWERMIDTNIKGILYISKIVIPWLKQNQKGHIINISSIAGKEVYPGGNVYCASKHAVEALSKGMRIDLVEHNIRVTNISPGAAETEFSIVRFKGDEKTAKSIYNGFKPLLAEDIAETVYFATTLPEHVNINDLTIMPTAQATSSIFNKLK